jgi:trehalose-phosphatase
MKALRDGVSVGTFLDDLAGAPSRVLLLDYDGTLAPFREERDRAVPYPGVREMVRSIQADGSTRVVVISGRTVHDLRPLLGLDPAPELWGTHGWERLRVGGTLESATVAPAAREALDRGTQLARALIPREHVEVKPASVAVHVRGFPDEEAVRLLGSVRAAWGAQLEAAAVELRDFDGGVELRARGRDKGTAVRELLSEEVSAAGIAYLGDDLTDEDAFRALSGRGLSVLVRPEVRQTSADVWIRPPEELLDFLHGWRRAARSARPLRTRT